MPRLTRWFVRAGLVYLVGALVLWTVVALRPGEVPAGLRPTILHFFMVGWITQLIFGVAFWMFPRASARRVRGDERLGWAALLLLNLGLLLRAIAEPAGVTGLLLPLSALLQWAAGAAWVALIWPRVRGR